MIVNNFHAMEFVRANRDRALTIELLLELHRILVAGTMEPEDSADSVAPTSSHGSRRLRRAGADVPPTRTRCPAHEALCRFANENENDGRAFIHPVVPAIALHFMIGYEPAFTDGNGAPRVLSSTEPARQKYWLA